MNDNRENLSFYLYLFSILVGVIVIIVCVIFNFHKVDNSKTTSPVEEMMVIDSINKVNTKLVIETEILDSIKDVEKDKVLNLDNDSTLRLFYELLRK